MKLNVTDRIHISGATTMVGAAIWRYLAESGFTALSGKDEPDLADQHAVQRYFTQIRPEYVFFCAGKSGGIQANIRQPATLMLDNLRSTVNVLDAARQTGVKKLLYVASACVYPRSAPQPMAVDTLMTGPLESTNEAYALAKLAGITLCKAMRQEYGAPFISAIPANVFGVGDHFDPQDSHVIGALIARMSAARDSGAPFIDIWGSGNPRREFVYVDDIANACVFALQHHDGAEPLNLGGGADLSIRELAFEVKSITGFQGELRFDASKPDGMPLKALDATPLLSLGWRPGVSFGDGLRKTYDWFAQSSRPKTDSVRDH